MRTLCFVSLLLTGLMAGTAHATYLECPANPSGTRVLPDNRYFDVTPKIVPADTETRVEVIPLFDHCRFKSGCSYELTYVPVDLRAERNGWVPDQKIEITPENGRYTFSRYFEGEQEHILYIEETCGDKRRALGTLHLFSLEKDLLPLRPFKGDFHMHSNRSDGVESPAYVAGACRRVGLDFMALTDHRKYAGSIEAQQAFSGVPIDLRIFPGEEVHPPDNPVHIVSFGANAGISELYQDEAAYRAEVAGVEKAMPALPEGVNRFQYASCLWAAGKIRERHGLSMFAHAYWFTDHHYYISEALRTHLFETQPFDALELISGFDWPGLNECDTNALQVARYQEERAKGSRIPVCGISDTHGIERSEAFGRYYTVCFSPSCEFQDLAESIKGLNSVAVEAVRGELPRAYGPFRLVKYALFLLREVFPQHDELCVEEGRLMLQYAAGDAAALERLRPMQGQTQRLYDHLWAPLR